ncbi:MAG: hypothetical protein AAGG51_26605 [Cyanobacteria bacterium P01_G01_bin.54]
MKERLGVFPCFDPKRSSDLLLTLKGYHTWKNLVVKGVAAPPILKPGSGRVENLAAVGFEGLPDWVWGDRPF